MVKNNQNLSSIKACSKVQRRTAAKPQPFCEPIKAEYPTEHPNPTVTKKHSETQCHQTTTEPNSSNLTYSLSIENPALGKIKRFNLLSKSPTASKARITLQKSGTFILKFRSPEDAAAFKAELSQSNMFGEGGHKLASVAEKASVLVLKGIPHWISTEDLNLHLRESLESEFKFERFSRNGTDMPVGRLTLDSRAEANTLIRFGITAGFSHIRCEWHKPSATRCFRCNQFGHTSYRCSEKLRCLLCGKEHRHQNLDNQNNFAHWINSKKTLINYQNN
ncbi:uncharacterized protein LOC115231492 [Octopus sinensis]|uniref:Uncharacterized protein LOC115231492 n=1 Tax=Octopus sinensis TaxID=2607531 RepID=A0A6P7U501_9MOLL|nr:uncharacterized protein LOC115231492 [Octopus sinensis]